MCPCETVVEGKSDAARAAIEHDPDDWPQGVILHKCVWHPALPGLAFVGMFRGPFFATIELQARRRLDLSPGLAVLGSASRPSPRWRAQGLLLSVSSTFGPLQMLRILIESARVPVA